MEKASTKETQREREKTIQLKKQLDNWKLEDAVKFSKIDLCMTLNKWYVDGLPEPTKVCRTILIFKAGERNEVGNWHPITIGPLLL